MNKHIKKLSPENRNFVVWLGAEMMMLGIGELMQAAPIQRVILVVVGGVYAYANRERVN